MRRLLLFFAATLFLCGAVNAQGWNTPDSHAKSSNTPIVASVQIDGVAPTLTELTEDFRLAAFVGDEVRGIAAAHTDGKFWIQVFYDQDDAETIYFCLWDGERIYASCDVTETTSETGDGTPGAPVVLNFSSSTTETETVALVAGTSWVSFGVETDLDALKAALVAALPGTAITINSQRSGMTTYNATTGRWRGTLSSLDLAQSYRVTVAEACEITLEGTPVDPADHPITIKKDVNWIGFPFLEAMSLSDAFAGFAADGDIVNSQKDGMGTYNANTSRWRGTLNSNGLKSGKGYTYTSTVEGDREFTYPTGSKSGANEK